ncbi:MAG: hypothetical protein ACOYXT_04430 [Bacteroidota bacterium]
MSKIFKLINRTAIRILGCITITLLLSTATFAQIVSLKTYFGQDDGLHVENNNPHIFLEEKNSTSNGSEAYTIGVEEGGFFIGFDDPTLIERGEGATGTMRRHKLRKALYMYHNLNKDTHYFVLDPKGDGSKLPINEDLLGRYTLYVVKGVLAEDYAMTPVKNWADYVFKDDYKLRNLDEVADYIKKNKHLPNIPSQATLAENGYSVHEMNIKMMEKIEELTLYLIEKENQVKALVTEQKSLRTELDSLKKLIKRK